jgi:hypothetical protein
VETFGLEAGLAKAGVSMPAWEERDVFDDVPLLRDLPGSFIPSVPAAKVQMHRG